MTKPKNQGKHIHYFTIKWTHLLALTHDVNDRFKYVLTKFKGGSKLETKFDMQMQPRIFLA